MSVKEQRGLTWAVERATKDSDGYASETVAARSAIAKLHATINAAIKFEEQARLAGRRDWAPTAGWSQLAMTEARETLGRRFEVRGSASSSEILHSPAPASTRRPRQPAPRRVP